MNEAQPELFSWKPYKGEPPSQAHSETSKAAALAIEPKAGTLRRKVLDFIASCGSHGATDQEIQKATGIKESTERPRRCELVEYGFIKDSGQTRKTDSGQQATVWVKVQKEA